MLMHQKGDRAGVTMLKLNHLLRRHELLPSLKYLCRLTIRNTVNFCDLSKLPLPPTMIRYLKDPKYLVPHIVRT